MPAIYVELEKLKEMIDDLQREGETMVVLYSSSAGKYTAAYFILSHGDIEWTIPEDLKADEHTT